MTYAPSPSHLLFVDDAIGFPLMLAVKTSDQIDQQRIDRLLKCGLLISGHLDDRDGPYLCLGERLGGFLHFFLSRRVLKISHASREGRGHCCGIRGSEVFQQPGAVLAGLCRLLARVRKDGLLGKAREGS